jgi:hypothetical protein
LTSCASDIVGGAVAGERPKNLWAAEPVRERVFEEVGLAFDEVYEEIRFLGGQGAELVEERLLGLQFPG